jgi:hypothetical protein
MDRHDSRVSELDETKTQEAEREYSRLHDEVGNAIDGLVEVGPTSIAGIVALLEYAAERAENGSTWNWGNEVKR